MDRPEKFCKDVNCTIMELINDDDEKILDKGIAHCKTWCKAYWLNEWQGDQKE